MFFRIIVICNMFNYINLYLYCQLPYFDLHAIIKLIIGNGESIMAYKNFKKTEIIDELGIELRKIRNMKSLTLAQVSNALKETGTQVSAIMLGRIETGQRRIDDDLFHALCDYYRTAPDELTIKACQAHIVTLQKGKNSFDATKNDPLQILKTYQDLPPNRQSDIRTMIRMYAYMDKFSKLDSSENEGY